MGFTKVIVKPLWEALNRFLSGELNDMVQNLADNISQWEKIFIENTPEEEK